MTYLTAVNGRFVPGASRTRSVPTNLRRRRTAASTLGASGPSFDQQLLDFRNGLSWIESLRAGLGAIHDGVAAIEAEGVLQIVQPVAGRLVAAVDDPAIGLQKRGGAEITVAVPPIAWA